MYRTNTFDTGSTLQSVADWLNESGVKLIAIEFAPTGQINVLYEADDESITAWKAYKRPDEGYFVLDPSGVKVIDGMNWHQVKNQIEQMIKPDEMLLYFRWENGEYVPCSPFSRI